MQIEDGEIYATINQKDGMVRFHDNPEMYNNVAMLMKLDTEVSSKNKDRNVEMCWSQTTFAFSIGDHYNVSFISY